MSRMEAIVGELETMGPVKRNEPLSRHVTFGVGGPADIFFTARSRDQLRSAFVIAAAHGIDCFVFGSGSNILVGDGGIRGLVIENDASAVDGPSPVEGDGLAVLAVDSGVSFAGLARRMCRAGWAGIEWAVGIPGSLGGAVVHNAGAYEGCLADILVDASISDQRGQERTWANEELGFSYRNSIFGTGDAEPSVVLGVRLLLNKDSADRLAEVVGEYDRSRTTAQPPGRNCGSVFKNPPGDSSWRLVAEAGLRGARAGNAQISEKHANFILNLGGATAADVKQLIDAAQSRVRERFGVELETEVNLVGEGFA
ncbi:MAG: UDP-N-acetylmuramate dehydrogenase [Dehalococcoidia bacterium]|nr:UDP-N-acetylmuramate dehydrogenase [Dehalococcoidia bacterium]